MALNEITLNKCLLVLEGKLRIHGRQWNPAVSAVYTEALVRLEKRVGVEQLLGVVEMAVYSNPKPMDPAEVIELELPRKGSARRGDFWEEEKPRNLEPGELARMALRHWEKEHPGEPDPPFIVTLRRKVGMIGRDMPSENATKVG